MRISNEVLWNAITLDGNKTSDPVWLAHIGLWSAQAVFTGTPSGNLKIQVSCDDGQNTLGAGVVNWTDLTDSITTVSAAGTVTYNVREAGYKWIRAVWTDTGSSGATVKLTVNLKGF